MFSPVAGHQQRLGEQVAALLTKVPRPHFNRQAAEGCCPLMQPVGFELLNSHRFVEFQTLSGTWSQVSAGIVAVKRVGIE